MTELHGVTGAPYATPGVRKAMPAPYERPSIHVGSPAQRRSWKDVRVREVTEWDTVAEFGVVAQVNEFLDIPDKGEEGAVTWRVRLYNVGGDWRDYPGHDRVYAFTKDPL